MLRRVDAFLMIVGFALGMFCVGFALGRRAPAEPCSVDLERSIP